VVQHLSHGVHEPALAIGAIQRGQVTHLVVWHIAEVPEQILADGRDSLSVGLACTLVSCVCQAGWVTLGYVRPLKQQLMPVIRAAHIERGLNNRMQFVLAGLTPEPCAVAVHNISGHHECGKR